MPHTTDQFTTLPVQSRQNKLHYVEVKSLYLPETDL